MIKALLLWPTTRIQITGIQITGIQTLPFIDPDENTKAIVEEQVRKIILKKIKDEEYNYNAEQKTIDEKIYTFYAERFDFPNELKRKLDHYSIYSKNV